jgi:hypothetical protein
MRCFAALLGLLLASTAAQAQIAPIVSAGALTREVCATPTVTAASAYVAGNVVGGLITLTAFRSSAQGAPDNGGIMQSIRITSKSVIAGEMDVFQFNANPTNTTFTDKTNPAINALDVTKVLPMIAMATGSSKLGTMTVWGVDGLGRAHVGTAGQSDYFVMVTAGTPTFGTTTDVQFCATYLLD